MNYKLTFIFFICFINAYSINNKWEVKYNSNTKGINVVKNKELISENLSASYKLDEKVIFSSEYAKQETRTRKITDSFGKGSLITITYTDKRFPVLTQLFYVYPDKDYILTEFTLEDKSAEIAVNYMAPVNLSGIPSMQESSDNRALFVPFDNDCWVRYQSHPLTFDKLTSYEVTAIFNNTSRKGIVLGSVEHDNWKSAIEMKKGNAERAASVICYAGVADQLTRDSKSHGILKGKIVKSPKMLFGTFNDWRTGMDEYGKANATIAPPKAWNKAVPFGWNSWGVLQFKLTFPKAMEVSDFFKNNLQNNGFANSDHLVYIGLDSGWNSFSEDQLKAFVRKCKENGQIAGVYWTPFTDWGKNPEATVGDAETYKFKDIYIYANGKPQELDGAYAIDPTHPAIEARMKKTSELFRRCGFEYVKMDFMTHGAMEGDKWYRHEIRTGMQAYNYGMKLLGQYFGDMYINLSISPIFPAQYAQSRRIACDAWNKIKDTEYTMNAVSYGWWIDHVYQYNDADHVVLQEATEGENRARVTSAVITGLYIAGDDFSEGGSVEGKEKAKKFFTNQDINAIANGISFRPVEGNAEKSENQFVRTDNNGLYYVVFNYGEEDLNIRIPIERLGLKTGQKYSAKELWSGQMLDINSVLNIPGKDVKVLRIY